MVKQFSMELAGRTLTVEIGKVAAQANGAALAYPSEVGGIGASIAKFLGIFATTQLPLAVIEGILTVVIVIALETYAKDELSSLEF